MGRIGNTVMELAGIAPVADGSCRTAPAAQDTGGHAMMLRHRGRDQETGAHLALPGEPVSPDPQPTASQARLYRPSLLSGSSAAQAAVEQGKDGSGTAQMTLALRYAVRWRAGQHYVHRGRCHRRPQQRGATDVPAGVRRRGGQQRFRLTKVPRWARFSRRLASYRRREGAEPRKVRSPGHPLSGGCLAAHRPGADGDHLADLRRPSATISRAALCSNSASGHRCLNWNIRSTQSTTRVMDTPLGLILVRRPVG